MSAMHVHVEQHKHYRAYSVYVTQTKKWQKLCLDQATMLARYRKHWSKFDSSIHQPLFRRWTICFVIKPCKTYSILYQQWPTSPYYCMALVSVKYVKCHFESGSMLSVNSSYIQQLQKKLDGAKFVGKSVK